MKTRKPTESPVVSSLEIEQTCRLTAEVAASLVAHDQVRIYLMDRKTKRLVTAYLSPVRLAGVRYCYLRVPNPVHPR